MTTTHTDVHNGSSDHHLSEPASTALVTPIPADLPAVATAPTADELAARWLLDYKGSTRDAYGRDLRVWGEFLSTVAGVSDPLLATRDHVSGYTRWLEEEGLSQATVYRRVASLASFYRYCEDEEAIGRTPVRGRRPKRGNGRVRLGLTETEARALLTAARVATERGEDYGLPHWRRAALRDYALVCLLTFNGLRVSEALNADLEHIGQEHGHQVLDIVLKGERAASTVLVPRVWGAIQAAVGDRTTGPIFATDSGNRENRQHAWRIVSRMGRKAEVGRSVFPHLLRHTAGTLMHKNGVALRDIQAALGHADPKTTARYVQALQDLDQHPAYRLALALSEGRTD